MGAKVTIQEIASTLARGMGMDGRLNSERTVITYDEFFGYVVESGLLTDSNTIKTKWKILQQMDVLEEYGNKKKRAVVDVERLRRLGAIPNINREIERDRVIQKQPQKVLQ